jgi:hypothetical protein
LLGGGYGSARSLPAFAWQVVSDLVINQNPEVIAVLTFWLFSLTPTLVLADYRNQLVPFRLAHPFVKDELVG